MLIYIYEGLQWIVGIGIYIVLPIYIFQHMRKKRKMRSMPYD
ncbi:hypothetical protein [Bacillus sp. FJAT-47783]|nr:hypothetical protein [Bacillus sp. FJAT-47783]